MNPLMLIALIGGGLYLYNQSQVPPKSTKIIKDTPKNQYSDLGYEYGNECKYLIIYDNEKFKKAFKTNLQNSYNSEIINTDNLFNEQYMEFRVIPFVQKLIGGFSNCKITPEAIIEQRYLWYILGAEGIDELAKFKFGDQINIEDPDYIKWTQLSNKYYQILKKYLNLEGLDTKIIEAANILKTTGKYP